MNGKFAFSIGPLAVEIFFAKQSFSFASLPDVSSFSIKSAPEKTGVLSFLPREHPYANLGERLEGKGWLLKKRARRLYAYHPHRKHLRIYLPWKKPSRIHSRWFLVLLLQNVLAAENGFLAHAAGIKSGRCCLLFPGKSGAGKTSLAGVCRPGLEVLSDDMVVLRISEDGVTAHATPFGRMTCGDNSAEVRAIVFLKHSDHFHISPIPRKVALARFVQEQDDFLYFAFKPLVRDTFHTLHEIFSRVSAFEMEFPLSWLSSDSVADLFTEIGKTANSEQEENISSQWNNPNYKMK